MIVSNHQGEADVKVDGWFHSKTVTLTLPDAEVQPWKAKTALAEPLRESNSVLNFTLDFCLGSSSNIDNIRHGSVRLTFPAPVEDTAVYELVADKKDAMRWILAPGDAMRGGRILDTRPRRRQVLWRKALDIASLQGICIARTAMLRCHHSCAAADRRPSSPTH